MSLFFNYNHAYSPETNYISSDHLICAASRTAPVRHGHKRTPAKRWCDYPYAAWTVVHIIDFSYQLMVQQYVGTLVFITGVVLHCKIAAFMTIAMFQHHGQQHYLHSPQESLNLSTTNFKKENYNPVIPGPTWTDGTSQRSSYLRSSGEYIRLLCDTYRLLHITLCKVRICKYNLILFSISITISTIL